MFNYITAVLLLLCAATAQAGVFVGFGQNVVCSTPDDGSLLNEGFLGIGYENTGWTEQVGANGTIDEDHTLTGTPPSGSCTEGLLTAIAVGATAATHIVRDMGTGITYPVDLYFEMRVNSQSFSSWGSVRIVGFQSSSGSWDSGALDLRAGDNGSGSFGINVNGSAVNALTTGAWHTIKIHLDSTPASSYMQIDGGSNIAFTRATDTPRYLFIGAPHLVSNDEAISIEWGRVWID